MILESEVKLQDILPKIAKELGTMDSGVQAQFLIEFMDHIYANCEGMHFFQLNSIRDKLNSETRKMLAELC
jgi:hypothetical protein